uniref:Retrotransposon Orf1 n=1 Tax=Tanacetum cinerariifolium TaxID=118510 RepID=A0A6L2LMF6_TANCI|nr:retrotransposon Orf1 [Tanacetum cinerariifolium]
MAKSSSSSENEACCSKSCRKNTEDLNTKITKLSDALSDSKTMLYHYKLGLSQVEARLVEFKIQEIKFCKKISGLEFNVESKNNRIEKLTNELEELKKEKEGLDSKLTGFESAAIDLNTLLGTQRSDKNKEGLGKSPVKYAEMYRNTTKSLKVRGNQRNWNNLMNQRLASNFEFENKACYECGSFDHLIKDCSVHRKQEMEKPVWNNARRVKHQNSPRITHPNLKRHMAPRKNLTRQVNTARPKAVINQFNDVKASACWVWKPIKPNIASITLKRYDYGNSGTKLEDSVRTKRSRGTKSKEVVDYIFQDKIKLLTKKLEDSKAEHQV